MPTRRDFLAANLIGAAGLAANPTRMFSVRTESSPTSSMNVAGSPVGDAPTGLIFLHAAAKPVLKRKSFRLIWDQQDTTDLLACYEVVYADGYVSTIPIRSGVNICEWKWDQRVSADDYCYNADALTVGSTKNRITLFAFEWINPRLGKVIQGIGLKCSTDFGGSSNDFNSSYRK